MANYNKSFNFRNGVQVDNDNFVVNANGLVGIGTSIPTDFLDVYGTSELRGDVTVTGLVTSTQLHVTGQSYLDGQSYVSGISTVGFLTSSSDAYVSGVVTATKYYGDGSFLTNIVGFHTTSWIVHTADGTATPLSGIATDLKVGIGTNKGNINYDLLIGQDPNDSKEGISFNGSGGDIKSSGIVTASRFIGPITGAVTGDVTGAVTGNVTGDVDAGFGTITTLKVEEDSTLRGNVYIGALESPPKMYWDDTDGYLKIKEDKGIKLGNVGELKILKDSTNSRMISTATEFIISSKKLRFENTDDEGKTDSNEVFAEFTSDGASSFRYDNIERLRTTGTGITVYSQVDSGRLNLDMGFIGVNTSGISTISIGQSVGMGNSSAGLRFGSPAHTFDIINYDNGDVNTVIDFNEVGVGTGNFRWIHKNSSVRMVLTYDGNLGIGEENPDHKLHVAGLSTFTKSAWFESDVDIEGTLRAENFNPTRITNTILYINSGISTVYNLNASNSIGVNTDTPLPGVDAQASTGYFDSVGISSVTLGDNKLVVVGDSSLDGTVGVGTTNNTFIGDFDYFGALQVYNGDSIFDGSVALTNKFGTSIGIGTTTPLCAVDFSQAGVGLGTYAYMLPPKLTTAERDGTGEPAPSDGDGGYVGLATMSGALIYNTTLNKLQVYNGSAWETITSST